MQAFRGRHGFMAILLPANMETKHASLAWLDIGPASSDVVSFADRFAGISKGNCTSFGHFNAFAFPLGVGLRSAVVSLEVDLGPFA